MRTKSQLSTRARCASVWLLLVFVTNAARSQSEPANQTVPLAGGHPIEIQQSQIDSLRTERERMKTTGYIERESGVPRPEAVRHAVEMQTASGATSARILELEKFDANSLGLKIPAVPTRVRRVGSQAFVVQANPNFITYIYLNTVFGTLLVDDLRGGKAYADGEPDFDVIGRPAYLSVVKFPEDKWTTTLGVTTANGHLLVVESDRRLEGEERDSFKQLAESLVESLR